VAIRCFMTAGWCLCRAVMVWCISWDIRPWFKQCLSMYLVVFWFCLMAFSNRLVDSQPSASLIMFQGLCFGTQFGRQVFGYFVLIIGQLLWTYNFGCICLFWVSWLN
jgi:hypothetical protein